ncbi:hypothetical protein [Deinococcus sp.]|uniref:hypothetical protein n=1 Tax=Deinococcus sp. TaxID=47478 RepID=UPI003C7C1EAB
MLESVSWIVHPLAGITLAFLASVIFTRQRRQWPVVLGAVGLLMLLSVLGAGWLVHPAAGLSIALLASTIFHAWRREWLTVLAALAALSVFSVLGAGWAIFPVMGLGLAWLLKVVFSGELLRLSEPGQVAAARSFAASPAALPAQGGGEAFFMGAGLETDTGSAQTTPERVAARAERKMQRRVAKLERKAEKLGVPLRVSLEQPVPEPAPPPAIRAPHDLLALSRDERLPESARARLGALHFRCREALIYLKDREQDGAGPGFLLRQIEADYAPEAVQAYLKLPPSLAGVTLLQDDKTGQDLLCEQLDLLLKAVQDIMQDAAQAGSQHLLAHRRFLRDRLAKPNDDLKL